MSAEFESRGVRLVGISADGAEDSIALIERLHLNFPLLSDDGVGVALVYGVAMDGEDIAVPSMFIVMPDRSVAWQYVGESAMDRPAEDRVLERLDAALAGG